MNDDSPNTPPDAARLRALRGLVLDCDGVLTTGTLFYSNAGSQLLAFDARDGFALAMLCRSGVQVGVVSGRPTEIVARRMHELGVHRVLCCGDKHAGLLRMCGDLGVPPAQTAYVGDDLPDLGAFCHAGLAIAVADAAPELRARADWTTSRSGGRGAVREVCEAILKARGEWERWLQQVARP